MQIIISPSKEMIKQAPIANRRPALLDDAREISDGAEFMADKNLCRATDLFNGLQFRYLRADLQEEDVAFLDVHLCILSAAYGVVKPFDPIRCYRQDFKTKGFYKAWGNRIYQQLMMAGDPILNLASEEFSKTVTRYSADADPIIRVNFYEIGKDAVRKKHASISKKSPGQIVNYIAGKRITDLQLVKGFDDMGIVFANRSRMRRTGCSYGTRIRRRL